MTAKKRGREGEKGEKEMVWEIFVRKVANDESSAAEGLKTAVQTLKFAPLSVHDFPPSRLASKIHSPASGACEKKGQK